MATDRREFIKKSFYGVLAILGLGFLMPAIKVLTPADDRDKVLKYFPLIAEDDMPPEGVKKAELAFTVSGRERKSRVFIVSHADNITVFSATCSHLGCLVNYRHDKREFVCPCHGGRYDLTGKNIAGPPPAPLTRLPARSQDGMILVGVKI